MTHPHFDFSQPEGPLAIPLCINGRAYLSLPNTFLTVYNPLNQQVLRRTPLCGAAEARAAVTSARAAAGAWCALPCTQRVDFLRALAAALDTFVPHFAQLIHEESGQDAAIVDAELQAVLALLRAPAVMDLARAAPSNAHAVQIFCGAPEQPLLSALQAAIPALLAGACVIVRPAPETPSALFALAELTGRCAWPAGVFNIVHGEISLRDHVQRLLDAPL